MMRQKKIQNAKGWRAKKHVKICSYSLVIIEMNLKVRYSFTTILLEKAFESDNIKH